VATVGRDDTIEQLLEFRNIDMNAEDTNRHTPLILVIRRGSASCVDLLLKTERVNFETTTLLNHTALQIAVYLGRIKAVEILISRHKAETNVEDRTRRPLVLFAVMQGHWGVARFLASRGYWEHVRQTNQVTRVLDVAHERIRLMAKREQPR
jgi:ankyrin repeat protein